MGMSTKDGSSPDNSKLRTSVVPILRSWMRASPFITAKRSALRVWKWLPRVMPGAVVEKEICPPLFNFTVSTKEPRLSVFFFQVKREELFMVDVTEECCKQVAFESGIQGRDFTGCKIFCFEAL